MSAFGASLFAVFAFIVLSQAGDPNNPEVLAAAEKCQTTEHATPADMEALKKYSMDLTKEAKCVLACMMRHFGIYSPDGKLQKDVYLQHAQEMSKGDATLMKHATEIYDACQNHSDPDVCESAYKYAGCMKAELIARKIDLDM